MRALVIDESSLSRSLMASLLREMGYQVVAASRPQEGLRALQASVRPFDVVLCEYTFTPRGTHALNGQEWLDELRQARVLPLATAVIMVTAEARYQCVADSVETALDDYLLKPFTAARLQERVEAVLRRKRALGDVYAACDREDFAQAAVLCDQLFRNDSPHRLAAARLGSELHLRLGHHDAALRLLKAVAETKALPWARLGLAKLAMETSNSRKASRALEALISDEPGYSDAYDLLGRAQIDELQFNDALQTYENAVKLTPGNVGRLQKLGGLQLLLGQTEAAHKSFEAALVLGASSPSLDYQSLFQLSLTGYDLKQPRACERPARLLADALTKHPQSYRLRQLNQMVELLQLLQAREHTRAVTLFKRMTGQALELAFDFEMACALLQLLTRMQLSEVRLDSAQDTVRTLGMRFAVSRPALEILSMSARLIPDYAGTLRASFDETNEMARRAMWHSLQGDVPKTVEALLDAATSSRNARFISLARASLDKHTKELGAELVDALRQRAAALQGQYCGYGTHASAGVRLRRGPSDNTTSQRAVSA